MGFNFTGFKDTKFPMLVKKLEEIYGEDHQLTHYIAPQFSIVDPRIDRFTIRELWDPKVQKKINGRSIEFKGGSWNLFLLCFCDVIRILIWWYGHIHNYPWTLGYQDGSCFPVVEAVGSSDADSKRKPKLHGPGSSFLSSWASHFPTFPNWPGIIRHRCWAKVSPHFTFRRKPWKRRTLS